ncbi:tetratricopeptide repeat protein [Tautonia marina]|uniref:tetratricopeptide repeat protein n=1 Tax=Tautonia marina TaxID=2653855 RepID=UPI00126116F0|nr:tetratricopeptide repeat protein [Tautonia marina]
MATLVILSLVLGGVLFTLQLTRPARLGNEAARQIRSLVAESERLLAESREAEDAETAEAKLRRAARQSDQALRHLNSYLERNPDDPEMAILRAELMAERATGAGPYEERVAQIHQRILVRFSNLPKEELDEVRYRLADLYIRLSDALQADYQQSGLAEQVVAQGRYPAAIELAQALDPNDPRTQALLGKAYEGQRDIPTALDAYERAWELYPEALAKAPDDEKPIEGILEVAWRMARLYRDHPEVDGNADEVLTELASILPDSAEALLVRFFFYRESDDPEKAGQALEDARDQAPEDPKVLITLVEHSLEQGDTATAKTAFQAIPEDYHRENRQRVAMLGGLIDHYERRTADAMTQWDEGLKVAGGNDADLAWWLAYVSLKTGEIEKAKQLIDQFKRLSGGNDNDPRYQLLLALDANARGDVQNAITILEALRARRGNPPLVQNKATQELASCYVLVGKNEEAEALFQDVEAADSGSSLVLVISHADVLENLGRTREAIDLLTTARTTFDDDPALLLLLLRLRLSEQSRQEPATRSWAAFDQDAERVQEMSEDVLPPQSLQRLELELMRADRHLLANQPDQADDRLKEAQKTWPTNSRLWAARAELLKRSGDPEAALALLEEGMKQAGDGPTLRLTLARLLVDLGRGREAQQRLIDGIDQLGSDAQRELWQALGRLRMAQGDYDGARAAFLSWSKLAPNAPEPILELIEVALLANRIPEAELYLDRLKLSNGENAISTRMAAASILLHQVERGDTEARDRCLTLVGEVLQEVPGLSSAHMLNGRIQEVIGNPEGAAEAYRTAWKQGNREALLRLVDQLVKLGQVEELEQLTAESGPGSAAGIRRVSAQALLAVGAGLDGADRLQDSAVEDPGAPAVANTVRARALLLAGRYDELEQLLDEQAEKQATPKNAAPWLELITTQVRLGRDQATLERTIDRALERSTGIPSELLEARLRWAIGDLQAADKVLEDALDNEIVNPDLIIGAASFYQQTGRPDRAEPLLERLMDNPSVAAGAALQLAMVLTERAPGDPETWKRARDLASNGPMTPERRLAIGVVQSRAPKPEQRREAIPVFETLMADLPLTDGRAVQARNQLARLLIELGEFDRAAQITEISADLSTAPAEAIVLHVRALLKADRLAEAGSQLSRLELLRPGDPEVADLRSDQLIRANAGNPSDLVEQVANRLTSPGGDLFARAAALQLLTVGTPEALEAADQIAQDLAQTTPGSQWVSGLVLAVRGRFEEALEQCAASLEAVDLTDQTARIGLTEAVLQAVQAAPITQRVDQVARARPIIATLLNKRPGDPDLLTASAILYHHAGDYQKEAELYREILERRPGDLLALYNLGLVLSEGLEQPEQGLAEIDRMERRVGPVPAVLGARGVILIRQKRFDEAIQALEQAVAIEPTAARHYYLALASLKSGRNDQFRTHLDQARTLGLDPNTIDPWHQDELQDILAR